MISFRNYVLTRQVGCMIFKMGIAMRGFLSIVGDSINEREIRKFEEGLNSCCCIRHLTRW